MPQNLYVQISGSLPPGGTTGQVLTKRTNSDGDADWEPGGGGSGITELTGDVTAGPGTGSQVASITWPVLAPDGSIAAPSYGFANDAGNDTGIFRSGNNAIGFATNGALGMELNFNDLTVTGNIAAANYPPTGSNSTMAGFSNSGVLESIPNFNIDTTSNGMNIVLTEQPNNGGGSSIHTWSAAFDPLQNSPNENWNIHNFNIQLDVNSSGFTQGTNGNAMQILSTGYTHHGTGAVGKLIHLSMGGDFGNGVDPVTIGGVAFATSGSNFHTGVTIDGPIQGYGFNCTVPSDAISTSNTAVNAFYDFSQVGVAVHGYNVLSASPNVAEIANNSTFQGFALGGTVTTLTGNAGYVGVGMFPAITTMSATGGFQGLAINPAVTTSHGSITGINIGPNVAGGDASFQGINIAPVGGYSTTNVQGININLSGIVSTSPQGAVGINSDSRLQINASTQLRAAQTFQIGSRIEHLFTVPNGSPVTGTDEIGVNMAGDFFAQDDVANGGIGLGFNAIGFISDIAVAATKTVDTVTIFLPACALPDPGFTTGGTVTDFNIIRSFPPLPQGGTLSIDNLYFLKLDGGFGAFASAATNAYGVYIDGGNVKNWLSGKTQLGDTTFAAPTHSLEVVGDMTVSSNVGFFGVAAAAQQTGGAQTAGAIYTATEQGMLQTVYDALRTFGLLS